MPGSDRDKSHRSPSEWKPEDVDMLNTTTAATTTGRKLLNVGIVGGGFAGLRCADVLLRHGHKVTIFEARNRLGGRVAQSDRLGHKVDLGPNWIHGTAGNPIEKLAHQTRTRLHSMDETQQIYDVDGSPLSPRDAALYGSLLWDEGLINDAFKHSEHNKESIPPEQSLWDHFKSRAEHLFTDLDPEEAKKRRNTLLEMSKMWGAYVGSPIERQSLKFYWLEECIEGENPFVAETYEKILEAVARPARDVALIRYGTRVSRIGSAQASGKPTLTTADEDSLHRFDEVVVTTPLGWLKRNLDAFTPPLTESIQAAVENLGYGCLDKVYLTFSSPWWDRGQGGDQHQGSNTIDTSGTTPNVAATSMPIHQSSSDQEQGHHHHHPSFTHWLSPDYDPSRNPEKWDVQAMNLSVLPDGLAQATLLFYIQGPCSQHIARLVREAGSDLDRDTALIEFFKPYFSRLPNYSSSSPECEPRAVLATAWANDEFAGYGSYSNFQVGLEHGDRDIEAIRHGMPERHVWFAGEHTAPFVALGTTTGAYWSGEKVAERIMKSYDEAGQT